jgi:hypothetical protein
MIRTPDKDLLAARQLMNKVDLEPVVRSYTFPLL